MCHTYSGWGGHLEVHGLKDEVGGGRELNDLPTHQTKLRRRREGGGGREEERGRKEEKGREEERGRREGGRGGREREETRG